MARSVKPRPAPANPLLFFLLAGVLVAAGAGGAWLYTQRDGANTPKIAAVEPKVETQQAAEPAAKPVEEAAKAEPEAVALPQFGLLRVEKDGSAVIAGTVPGGSDVELLANGEVIGKAKTESGGDFAIVLDNPLKAGDYELSIRAIQPDGKTVISQEAGIISIPGDGGEIIAMIAKEGEASRIIQKPEGKQDAVIGEEAKPEEAAKLEAPKVEEAAPEVEPVPEIKSEPQAEPQVAPKIEIAPARQVLVEAVDVESGKIFVAGSGEPGRKVQIYLDDAVLGTAVVGAQGGFLLEALGDMAAGTHKIRADLLSADGAIVANRAEVPLIHEPVEAAKPAEAPKVEETSKAAETPKVEEVAKAAEAPKVEEVAKAVEAPKVEEVAKAAEAPKVEELAKAAEAPKVEEVAKVAEAPAVEDTEEIDESAGPAQSLEIDEAAKLVETPKAEESAEGAETPKVEEVAKAAETPTVEGSVETAEAARIEEAPKTEEVAKAAETPKIEAALKVEEEAAEEAKVEAAPKVEEEAKAAEITVVVAEPLRTGASVIIRQGDNLWRISRRMLGRGIHYTVIYEANRSQIRNPRLIYPGQVFAVPVGQAGGSG